jgi:uncharacterized membrane protein YbhN (UPF0104 family)
VKKIKLPKYVSLSLKLLLSVLALYLVFSKIDVLELGQVLKDISIAFLLFAAFQFILSKVVASLRLGLFLHDISIPIHWKANLRLYWLGMYYNLFLPGGIGGDGYKIYLLNKQNEGVKTKTIFSAVLIDRISGVWILSVLAAALALFLPFCLGIKMALAFYIPISVVVFYVIIRRYFPAFQKHFLATSFLSLGVQIPQLISALFILLALGVNKDISTYLFVFLLSSVVAMIPFTIGGIGARELTFIYAAQYFGLDMEPAVALSFLFFLITALVSFYGIRFSFYKHPDRILA